MKIFSRMFCRKDIPLFGHGNMGVDFRDVNGTMAKHFLDITDIDICFQKAGGKCMAEHVRGDMQVN